MTIVTPLARHVLDTLRPIPNYPKPGIIFQDITPVLRDGPLFRAVIDAMADPFREEEVSHVIGIEARGFILGGAVAANLGVGFVPARKPGKLPWEKLAETYDLEYGTDALECHRDGLPAPARVLIVDDVLATGGSAGQGASAGFRPVVHGVTIPAGRPSAVPRPYPAPVAQMDRAAVS
jgi:adenine phosphoribosyltransferase